MTNTRFPIHLAGLLVVLTSALLLPAQVEAVAPCNHVEPVGELLLRNHGHRPIYEESTASIFASPRCLEVSDPTTIETEAAHLIETFPKEHITAVTFVCAPKGLAPENLMIGFTHFPDARSGQIAKVSAHRTDKETGTIERLTFKQVTAGAYRVRGFLGSPSDPWGVVVQRGAFYPQSTVFNLIDGTSSELIEWGGPILIENEGAVDLVWLTADGVHLHSTDPVVVWKLFRNAKEPELFGQQMSWTLVDDKPGHTIRIVKEFLELEQSAQERYPQCIP